MRTKKIIITILFMPFSMFSIKTGNIKTLIFAFLCVILITDLYGQNTFPQNGNVGIGTLNPSNKLHVIGGISSSDVSEIYGVRFSLENTYYRQIMAHGYNLLINSGSGDAHFLMPYNSSSNARLNNLGLIVDKNMGIGTAIPEDRLTVLMDPASNGNGIAVKAATNQGAGSQPGYAYLNSSGNRRMYNYLDIQTDTYNIANAQASNLLTINQSGNVGIGTSNPEFKLDLQGGNANINLNNISSLGGQLTISNGYGNQNGAVRLNLNNGGAVSWIKGIVTGPNTNTGSAIVFGVPSNTADGVERMRITSTGDVGIGTENPLAKLQVAGNIRQNFSSGDGDGFSQYSGLTHILSITRQVNNLSLSAFDGIGLAPGSANGPSNNYALYAMSGGNVGIGTNKPSEKLSVNGKIRAHEIKVETANWPDYVFKEDYPLPTLKETEKHIKENGHLQGIPSAAVVKTNGIDLGEMNAKLLQKIEELTLYLIQNKKETDLFKNTIEELKKENQFFKTTLQEIILRLK